MYAHVHTNIHAYIHTYIHTYICLYIASNFRGVYKCGKKWKSQIQIRGQQIYLGVFDTELEAAESFDDAVRFNSKPSQFPPNNDPLSDLSSDRSEDQNDQVVKKNVKRFFSAKDRKNVRKSKINTPNDMHTLIVGHDDKEESVKFIDDGNCDNNHAATATNHTDNRYDLHA